jgi:hypothetical protein
VSVPDGMQYIHAHRSTRQKQTHLFQWGKKSLCTSTSTMDNEHPPPILLYSQNWSARNLCKTLTIPSSPLSLTATGILLLHILYAQLTPRWTSATSPPMWTPVLVIPADHRRSRRSQVLLPSWRSGLCPSRHCTTFQTAPGQTSINPATN